MMRDSPPLEPSSWGVVERSRPRTRSPRRDDWSAAALPCAPRPTTITSASCSTGADDADAFFKFALRELVAERGAKAPREAAGPHVGPERFDGKDARLARDA